MSDEKRDEQLNWSKKNKDSDHWEREKNQETPEKNPLFKFFNKGQFHFSIWYFLGALILMMFLNNYLANQNQTVVSYSTFKEKIAAGEITEVQLGESYYLGRQVRQSTTGSSQPLSLSGSRSTVYKTYPVEDPSFVSFLDEMGVSYYGTSQSGNYLTNILLGWIVPFLLLMFVWRMVFKRMGNMGGQGVMSFGKNQAQLVAEGDTGVTFDDVAGVDEAKNELVEIVDFLKNPQKYREIGGKVPKGVLLVGSPGTGKTLLARAVAGSAQVPFFRISGADFVEMFVGVGAARVRDLFKQAREKSPCIIFIDELDAIGKSRIHTGGGNDEREQTLNQLLVEMDGFDSRTGVIILGATNRPETLDPALMRPGRFDRQVAVDKPDLNGRLSILEIHSQEVKMDDKVNLRDIARATPGFVGADLANIINEAALLAVRGGRVRVTQADLQEAIEKAVAGLEKKNRLINPHERRIVAFHETGHAMTAALTPGTDPVHKITIIPRGIGSLGYTMQTPTEDRFLMSRRELLSKIDVLLGGRAAESIVFNEVSTGAANDLTRATDIARKMITEFGMSDRFENMVLTKQGNQFLGEQGVLSREYSDDTQLYIDTEIARIIKERYQHVRDLLKEKREDLNRLSERLLKVETLDAEEFYESLGIPRPQNDEPETPESTAL